MWVNRRLRPVLDAADVVLAVGTRMQGFGLRPGQRVVHVDVDADQIGRNSPVERRRGRRRAGSRSRRCSTRCATLPRRPRRRGPRRAARRAPSIRRRLRAIGPQVAHRRSAARRRSPTTAILVPRHHDRRLHVPHALPGVRAAHVPVAPRTWARSASAIPHALGAKVARPDRPVVDVVGDGGFLFAATEMATAVQHGIHTVTVVFDDGAYGNSNRDQREKFGGREFGTRLRNPDWATLAGAVRRREPAGRRHRPSLPEVLREALRGRRVHPDRRADPPPAQPLLSPMSDLEALVEQLAARLQAVEDELAITRLLTSYGFAVDGDDADACAALYSPDALVTIDDAVRLEGRDEIRTIVTFAGGDLVRVLRCS